MGIGKWIGGVLGFMAFGPLGALAGIILGSFFEEGANMTGQSFGGGTNYDDQYTRRDPYAGERNSFLFSMLVMASYIIRADGKIMHSEAAFPVVPPRGLPRSCENWRSTSRCCA